MPRRPARLVLLACACLVISAACTPQGRGSGSAPGGSSAPASSAPVSSADAALDSAPASSAAPAVAQLDPPTEAVDVVGGSTPGQLSVGASRALFASAPAAVVAVATDATGVARGARDAARLGIPLLLRDTATSRAAATPDPLAGEIDRLGCGGVLDEDDALASAALAGGARVVSDPAQLPPTAPPSGGDRFVVLVRAGDEAATQAAAATAAAAGAAVVGVQGNDPRADPHAIAALTAPQLRAARETIAVGPAFGPADRLAGRLAVARTGVQLPGGGQVMFPGRRLVALYGHPGGATLGVLGAQDLQASIGRARDLAASYDPLSDVPVVPAFEIIATVAQRGAGADGNYSAQSSVESLRPWVEQAQAAGLYVVLDLQPGRADPLAQAKLYEPLLREPGVGLAIDAEWALAPGEQPLEQIGSVDSSRINAVGAWLDALTASAHLPQKLFVLHQFRLSMIGNEAGLRTNYDNVAVLIHMDGQGTPPVKDATWRSVTAAAPKGVPFGWKNFYREDHPMLTPEQTMSHHPVPLMISYQ